MQHYIYICKYITRKIAEDIYRNDRDEEEGRTHARCSGHTTPGGKDDLT